MTKKLHKGFTLIELLVVIAIIGILSSIVLASLNTARAKGADAAIKGDLNGIRAQAELFYDIGQTYGAAYTGACAAGTGVFANVNVKQAIAHAVVQNGGTDGYCGTTGTAYAAEVPLKSGGQWCVDSTGVSRSGTSATPSVAYTTQASAITAGASNCN